jgi:hypothetical protein
MSTGSSAWTAVPSPGALMIVRDPLAASTRSSRPVSPVPRVASAPPTPSSRISMTRVSPSRSTLTLAFRARECLTAFVSDSATMK